MQLKTIEVDGKTYAEVADGKPVYVIDGKETPFDAGSAVAKIGQLNGEAKSHREAKEAAEKALKAFEGIEDPKAARDAIKTMAGLDAKALIDAGKADEMRAAAIKAVEEKYAPMLSKVDELTGQLRQEKIGGSFARSKFIAEKLAVPVPMIEATFGRHFEIEGGKVIAKDASGNQIYSRSKPGEPADFDEALETLVETFPYRDQILKGRNQNGTAATGGGGGGGAGPKTMNRAQFDGMSQAERSAKIRDGYRVVDA